MDWLGRLNPITAATSAKQRQAVRCWVGAHLERLIPLLVAGIAALQTSYLVSWSVRELTERGVAMDDSYFYAVLAHNYERVGYWTFDGSMPTNGVQPLWQWMIVGLHQALPNVDVMRSSFVANWILYALFCWLIVRYVLSLRVPHTTARVLVVSLFLTCNPGFQQIVLRGMEVPLFLVCFATLLNTLELLAHRWKAERASAWYVLLLAALSATTFLARTDWFWVVPLGAGFVWHRTKAKMLLLLFLGTASMFVLPYLLHNLSVHGHLMPISGRAKLALLDLHASGFGEYLRSKEWHGVFSMLGGMFTFEQLWLSIPLTLGLAFVGVRRFGGACPSVRFLLVGVACHTLFMHLAYREVRPYTRYYFSVEGIAATYLVAEIVVLAMGWLRRLVTPARFAWGYYGATCTGMLFSLGATLTFRHADPQPKWVWRWQMGETLRALPSDAKIAAFWPGAFAYVSGRSVFPLDGIVGSAAYLDTVVLKGHELAYARSRGIDYVVINDLPPPSVYGTEPPRVSTWAEMGKLRLWQDCAFVKGLVASHGDSSKGNGWYLYEFSDLPSQARCERL
jgi:hypothetical protein